jgi:hypothetical protein
VMSGQGYVSATRRSGQIANRCDDDEHSGCEYSRKEVRHRARTEKRIVSMREVLLFIVVSREGGRHKAAESVCRVERAENEAMTLFVRPLERVGLMHVWHWEGRIRLVLMDEDACAVRDGSR